MLPRLAPVLLVLALAGCGRDAAPAAVPTAEEQRLLEVLTTDGFVEIVQLERDSRGALIAVTRQGSTRVRYAIAGEPGQPLALRRIEDRVKLTVADDGTRGTGPEPRGLR